MTDIFLPVAVEFPGGAFAGKRKRAGEVPASSSSFASPTYCPKRFCQADVRKPSAPLYRKRKRPGEDVTFCPVSEFDDSHIPLHNLNPHKRVKTIFPENVERAVVLYRPNSSEHLRKEESFDVKFEFPEVQNHPQRFLDPNFCTDIVLYSKNSFYSPISPSSESSIIPVSNNEEEEANQDDDIMMID